VGNTDPRGETMRMDMTVSMADMKLLLAAVDELKSFINHIEVDTPPLDDLIKRHGWIRDVTLAGETPVVKTREDSA